MSSKSYQPDKNESREAERRASLFFSGDLGAGSTDILLICYCFTFQIVIIMALHYDLKWITEKFDRGDNIEFQFFWGHTNKEANVVNKSCLSQWFESSFVVESVTYLTAEHWMMAQKAILFDDWKSYEKIIHCTNTANAKELGRFVLGFDEITWNKTKFDIVKIGNIHKFNQNKALGSFLIDTHDKVLVEASPSDTVWGIGLSQEEPGCDNIHSWQGQNLLGFALMEVRDFLNDFGFFNPLDAPILPPWIRFPGISPYDMFWRMGGGEDYISIFSGYYNALSERDKTVLKLTHPQPWDWNFYDE